MQPVADFSPVPSPDPFIAQSRKDFLRGGPVGTGEPSAGVVASTETRRRWLAATGYGGGGNDAGALGSAGVGRGEADLPRADNLPSRPPLARCCGARTRSGPGCLGLAMANGRCRMHGGASTGPRTPEGFAKLVAAPTRHGRHGAAKRALRRHDRAFVERTRLLAEAETAMLAPWKAGIAQALMARRMALVGRRAARDAAVRNDPIGGRGMDGGGSAIGGGEQRPYMRSGGGDDDVAVRAACRAVRDADVRNDPIGGRAMGGGGSVIGAGEQRPYIRSDGGGVAAGRAARRAVRVAAVRNDPIGGRATGGGAAALGAGEQRPYRRHEGASGDAGDDGAMRAGDAAVRVAKTSNDAVAGGATWEKSAIGAGAPRPHARQEGAGGGFEKWTPYHATAFRATAFRRAPVAPAPVRLAGQRSCLCMAGAPGGWRSDRPRPRCGIYAAARSGPACGGSGQALEGAGLCHPALDVEVRVCGGLAKPGCAGHLSWSAALSRPACTHGSSTPGEPEAPAPPMTSVPSLIGSPPGMAMMLGSVTCWRTTGLLSAKRLA